MDSDSHAEAVDLTFSSPEPESRPRHALQQQRLPSHFKVEARSHDRHRQSKNPEFRTSRATGDSLSQDRPVAPQDLARIIDTSSSTAIKNVLLELCKMSPALSGAVARGLAAHSTYAQDLINKHQQLPRPSASTSARTQIAQPSAVTHVKTERSSEEDVYRKTKERLASRLAAQASSSRSAQTSQGTSTARNPHASGSRSVTSIKRHHPVDLGDSDSDLDTYIPKDFPLIGELKVPTPRLRQTASQMTGVRHISRSTPGSEISSRTVQAKSVELTKKNCTRCEEDFDDEEKGGVCIYHQGPKTRVNDSSSCSSCRKPWSEIGCALGSHIAASKSGASHGKQHLSHRSKSPSKRLRLA